MKNFKSEALQCSIGDNHCALCSFVDGARDNGTLLEVIEKLDFALSKREQENRQLLNEIAELKTVPSTYFVVNDETQE